MFSIMIIGQLWMELRSVCRKNGRTNYKSGCRRSNGSNDADAIIIVKISTGTQSQEIMSDYGLVFTAVLCHQSDCIIMSGSRHQRRPWTELYFSTEVKAMIKTITKLSRIEINAQHALVCILLIKDQTCQQPLNLMYVCMCAGHSSIYIKHSLYLMGRFVASASIIIEANFFEKVIWTPGFRKKTHEINGLIGQCSSCVRENLKENTQMWIFWCNFDCFNYIVGHINYWTQEKEKSSRSHPPVQLTSLCFLFFVKM